ncbi:MAG: hypothetical protein SGILL_000392 [Bacillariaceae sp.]
MRLPISILSLLVAASSVSNVVVAQTADFAALQSRLEAATSGLNSAAFQDTSTYQSQALLRTSQQIGVDSFTDDKLVQYYSLYCIYYATYAVPNEITDADPRFVGIVFPHWLIYDNWDKIDVDPCNGWHGIECDETGRVTHVNLYENTLTGSWPEEVKLLAADGPFATGAGNLIQIDLFRNEFLTNGGESSWMTSLGSNISTCCCGT